MDYVTLYKRYERLKRDNLQLSLDYKKHLDEIYRLREALQAIVALKEAPSLTADDIADDADEIARSALWGDKE